VKCDDYLHLLETADLALLTSAADGSRDAMALDTAAPDVTPDERAAMLEHHRECASCRVAATLLMEAQRELGAVLRGDGPSRPSAALAEHAWLARQRAWRQRVRRMVMAAMLAAFAFLTWRYAVPEMRRLLAPPPPTVTETFSLTCLSPAQAASLLRPYLPAPENPRWQAEHFSVTPAEHDIRAVTVRAPRALIDRVPELLARFERDPNAACRRRSTDARETR
jgi:hypothetical protein